MRLVIANPSSCGGKALEVATRFETYLRQEGVAFVTYKTLPTDNKEAIQKLIYKHNIHNISILGGDGTMNMVVNAIPHLNFTFHLIPAGTGNDLAKMVYGNYTEEFVFRLVSTSTRTQNIDCWKCNEHRFCNGFGAGFDGAVAHRMYQKNYWLPSKLKYWIEIFRLIFSYRSTTLEVNGKQTPVFMLAAANGQVYGGGFNVAPDAVAFDGLLDVIKIGKVSVLRRFIYLPKIEKGKHLHLDVIKHERVSSLQIRSPKPLPVHLDGEPILANNYRLSLEGQMKFIV